MSTMNSPLTISRYVSSENDLNYEFLKQTGIIYIEAMGSKLWTDYNEHDPGITMLEVLSYAITDLGNRISMPMQNLLTEKNNVGYSDQFYEAGVILTSEPVTELDYRKLFIDLEGVRNCWIYPYDKTVYANCLEGKLSYDPASLDHVPLHYQKIFSLGGLNRILLEYEPDIITDEQKDAIKATVFEKYHQHRNLGEDLVEVGEVEEQCICLCTDIELNYNAEPDEVHAKIIYAIQNYFSPVVRFYSVSEMLEKGYRTDEIFEGPLLEHGFIDSRELQKSSFRSEVRLSDLIRIISEIDGVKVIRDITLGGCTDRDSVNGWIVCLEQMKKPVLCKDSTFNYKKGVVPVSYDQLTVDEWLQEFREEEEEQDILAGQNRFLTIPDGQYQAPDEYTTIQNAFPETYGIGIQGISDSVSTERKSKSKQLKAYLLFFDQVLASYFAHLGKVKDQLSVNSPLKHSYFTQAVSDLNGIGELVQNYPQNDNELLTDLLMSELDDVVERKNEILDHLLARFAENFSQYAFLMKNLYGSQTAEMVLYSKEVFLKEYVSLSSPRGTGFDYYMQPTGNLWDTANVSGVQKRILRLAGVKDYFRRNLVNDCFDIYVYNPSPGIDEYKWRIRNYNAQAIITSVNSSLTYQDAQQELYNVALLVSESSENKISEDMENPVTDGQIIDCFRIRISASDNYYFEIVSIGETTVDVLARQYSYYITQQELKQAIVNVIDFLKYQFTEEGMYLIEHILLRPDVTIPDEDNPDYPPEEQYLSICNDACNDGCQVDPYSFQVSIVLPGYTERFADLDFRTFMEDLIQRELPAHIQPRICWVGYRKGYVSDNENELLNFQQAYKNFLLTKTDLGQGQDSQSLVPFIDQLLHLNSVYPEGKLEDCEGGNVDGKVILGRTKLGTI